ncbi:(2Fe-2S)-binding protein, partial [Streptomyces albidoflavus]
APRRHAAGCRAVAGSAAPLDEAA